MVPLRVRDFRSSVGLEYGGYWNEVFALAGAEFDRC